MDRPLLSVIIPVHNEQENLPELYRRLVAAVNDLSHLVDAEFVFVEDGSTDASLSVLQRLVEEDYRVVVVRLTRNWGSHAALKAGLHAGRGDCFAAISADLQDPPEMLGEFYQAHLKGFEVVWGIRSSRRDPLFKKFWAHCFYAVFRKLALVNLPAGGVDTFLISRIVRDQVLSFKERHCPPYYHLLWLGYPYAVVPYQRAARKAGLSKWTFYRRWQCGFDALLSFSPMPLRLLAIGGTLLILASLIFGTFGEFGLPPLLGLLSGLQLLGMGILGAYLWRVAEDVRHRPEYCLMNRTPEPITYSPKHPTLLDNIEQLHSATNGPANSLR